MSGGGDLLEANFKSDIQVARRDVYFFMTLLLLSIHNYIIFQKFLKSKFAICIDVVFIYTYILFFFLSAKCGFPYLCVTYREIFMLSKHTNRQKYRTKDKLRKLLTRIYELHQYLIMNT